MIFLFKQKLSAMKKTTLLISAFVCTFLASAPTAKAAFPLKNNTTVATATTATPNNPEAANVATTTFSDASTMQQQATIKKHKKVGSSAAIPQGLYILLSIFWLGWLAMGINDDWNGTDWLISLLLYCLFWLPGFIYSLVKMKKYY